MEDYITIDDLVTVEVQQLLYWGNGVAVFSAATSDGKAVEWLTGLERAADVNDCLASDGPFPVSVRRGQICPIGTSRALA